MRFELCIKLEMEFGRGRLQPPCRAALLADGQEWTRFKLTNNREMLKRVQHDNNGMVLSFCHPELGSGSQSRFLERSRWIQSL
jgi:hypothetical protein